MTYTPTTTFTGTAVFTYTANDGWLSDTATVTVTVAPGDVVTTVEPTMGATLVYTNPQTSHPVTTTLDLPAGAVTETITLIYTEVPSSTHTPPAGFRFAGRIFTLNAYLGGAMQAGFVFQKPITVTLDYNPDDLAGLNEEALELRFWDVISQTWSSDGITVIERDTTNHRLVVTLTHLTEFSLLGAETGQRLYLPLVVKD